MVADTGIDYTGPILFIVGETATGKTDLAIHLALKHNAEIVSADSWVVRKNVDIGTAKPSKQQLKSIKHHMIDIIGAEEAYSAARYKKEAEAAILNIAQKGKLPIVVGGTGLYIDALLYDFSFLPPADSKTREYLNVKSLNELIEQAKSAGLALGSIDTRNKRRVIRLIETNGGVAERKPLRPNTYILGLTLNEIDREVRIVSRVDNMLSRGLELEVERLYLRYGWDCEALKGIGYSEWRLYFEGKQTIEITRQRIVKDTLSLAKRQRTWFKRNKSIHWYATTVNYSDIDEKVTTFLNKNVCEMPTADTI